MNLKKYGILSNVASMQWLQFSLIFLLSGCFWSKKSNNSDLIIVNVLDSDYYEDCHIPSSINVPFEQIEEIMKSWNKNAQYVFYCSNFQCTAAPFAALMLEKSGFKNVSILPGGIVDWYQSGFTCTVPCEKTYLQESNEALDDDHMGVQCITPSALNDLIKARS